MSGRVADDPVVPAVAQPKKHRSRWLWVSALLAVVSVGLLVWGVTVTSDLHSTQDDLDSTSHQLSSTKQELDATKTQLDESQQQVADLESAQTSDRRKRIGGAVVAAGGLATVKAVYDDLAAELGATQKELEATQADLKAANKAADQATQDAQAAKKDAAKAGDDAAKAEAQAAEANAEAKAEKAKRTVVADCTKAYISAFGGLFEGDSVRDQAAIVRKDFAAITDDCKGAPAGS